MENNRRDFLKKSALLGLSGIAGSLIGKENLDRVERFSAELPTGAMFTLPPLSYDYAALEPFIDKETMTIHHTKHHQAYVDKLNKALENYKGDVTFSSLFTQVSTLDPAIRNNGGGHYNHSLFWILMKPFNASESHGPFGNLGAAIKYAYKTPEEFKKEFADKSMKIFGSGWCWLIVNKQKQLQITTTPNQDNPLMDVATDKGAPILALDIWEHAYYLKYQNKRVDYITNWWNLVDWQRAENLYNEAMNG